MEARQAVLVQTRQIASDHFLDFVERLFLRSTLNVGSKQGRVTRHLRIVLIHMEHHQQSADFAVVLVRSCGIDNRRRITNRSVRAFGNP